MVGALIGYRDNNRFGFDTEMVHVHCTVSSDLERRFRHTGARTSH
jgi:hypothetical protein